MCSKTQLTLVGVRCGWEHEMMKEVLYRMASKILKSPQIDHYDEPLKPFSAMMKRKAQAESVRPASKRDKT